jgi:2-methylfumaryl-CoA isomerase
MQGLLKGLTLIEGSAFVAAPLGGMTLAQLGAEVIRFDTIGGGLDYRRWPVNRDGKSLYWPSLNKGKKSITLDIRSEKGQGLVHDLIEATGTFSTNFPARGWLDYDALKARRKDLVMVNVQGNPDGSSELDYTVNCAAGYPFATGPKHDLTPVNHVLPAWDVTTGIYTALALVAADRNRLITGEGQLIKIALSDVAFATTANLGYFAEIEINKEHRQRIGNDLFGSLGRDFVTKDGKRIMMVAITPRQWKGLCESTGLGDAFDQIASKRGLNFGQEGDRFIAREDLCAALEPWFAANDYAYIEKVFNENAVCWGPYRTFTELLEEDPRASEANPMFKRTHQPGIGDYLMPGSPLRMTGAADVPPTPAPLLGQHTDEVLTTLLNLSDQQIGALHDGGVVAGPEAA